MNYHFVIVNSHRVENCQMSFFLNVFLLTIEAKRKCSLFDILCEKQRVLLTFTNYSISMITQMFFK